MPLTSIIRARLLGMLLLAVMLGSSVLSADTPSSQLYRITTETGMPHLEENLRNLITHETRCVGERELFTTFPVLDYSALRGCKLAPDSHQEDVPAYELECDGAQQTTGRAVWSRAEDRLTGTLSVKLGGKNMTFYQRVTAVRVGDCVAPSE